METQSLLLRLPPSAFTIDNARNLSRAGLAHDPTAIREMADRLLEVGQLSPVEVVAPEGWDPEDWAYCISHHGAGLVAAGEHAGEICPPGILNFGFRRHAAALLLAMEDTLEPGKGLGLTSPQWDGLLLARVAPAGLTPEQLEDRNLVENLGHHGVAFIDLGLAAKRLCGDPKDGGRGEEKSVAALRLGISLTELERVLLLPQLCPEAQALSRLHHHNPERGLKDTQALKLARRPVEEQQALIAAAKDAANCVTPKAMAAAIAPHQGRQGQPPGATGAQLTRGAALFDRLARTEDPTLRYGLDREAAAVVRDILRAYVSLDPDALARLPNGLGKRLEAVVNREEK